MNVKALGIFLGSLRIGVLFEYAMPGAEVIHRFVADEDFARRRDAPVLSTSFLADTPEQQAAFWLDVRAIPFNGRASRRDRSWLLPAFFQNLLPEGVFRDRIAEMRQCDPRDHLEMLAACGLDLPGNVYARPLELTRDELARYVTQNNDALEMSVMADPMEEGVSLSGVQPKLAVLKEGGRYVGRTKEHDTHIIAKLPVVGQPRLPELEYLSLRLAAAAGVSVCEAYLEPLETLAVEHGYDLGDVDARTRFLAVVRYDRSPQGRIHCEDFAQVLGVMPEDKYTGEMLAGSTGTRGERASYLAVAAVLMSEPSLGEPAVHELLRRLMVNELLGNPDMHLKNMGLRYPDGVTPEFPPAYDIVGYAAFARNSGHALAIVPPAIAPRDKLEPNAKPSLSPAMLRVFCERLGIAEKPAASALRACVKAAVASWPALIGGSDLTARQKELLLAHFEGHSAVRSLQRRAARPSGERHALP
ncbi:type II toxin-antitoxin system HipA family toxin [Variovorax sp. RA8]|uniref:type II toxin-antitoxin system HipA family toxin n=1 Tax=Variovorax sp. (strain JCM 16519 / RA8) TaxID=662548 RepID=UPI0013186E14|nr:type II toxin-antitoxin system HipA family toxin [Variovorax sp. RA8]VTU25946.1 Serine/threonine-protein kinase HipA [Variovorax sp. RA8]